MFTGIIEEVGTVAELSTDPNGGRLRVACAKLLPRLGVSSSVAVSGCCLTIVRQDEGGFWGDLAPETLARTGLPPLARRLRGEPGSAAHARDAARRPHRAGPRGRRRRAGRTAAGRRRQLL